MPSDIRDWLQKLTHWESLMLERVRCNQKRHVQTLRNNRRRRSETVTPDTELTHFRMIQLTCRLRKDLLVVVVVETHGRRWSSFRRMRTSNRVTLRRKSRVKSKRLTQRCCCNLEKIKLMLMTDIWNLKRFVSNQGEIFVSSKKSGFLLHCYISGKDMKMIRELSG